MENDTRLGCLQCGKTHEDNISNLLRNGWKQCCGEAMHLMETNAEKVNTAMKSMSMRYNKATHKWEISPISEVSAARLRATDRA